MDISYCVQLDSSSQDEAQEAVTTQIQCIEEEMGARHSHYQDGDRAIQSWSKAVLLPSEKVSFFHRWEWKHASKYVAKVYMEKADRSVYAEDVSLKMDDKL